MSIALALTSDAGGSCASMKLDYSLHPGHKNGRDGVIPKPAIQGDIHVGTHIRMLVASCRVTSCDSG